MSKKSKNNVRAWIITTAVIAVAAAIIYGPHLRSPFLFDDLHTIRDNPALRSHLSPLFFFNHPESASRAPITLIRPLLTWTYAVNYHLSGPDPSTFRLTNLLIHALNALLVFGLTRKTKRLKALALPCSLIFLLHPLNSMEIGYLSCRSTLLSSFFYLAALFAFAHALDRGDSDTRGRAAALIILVCLLFAAGLFSKSVMSTLPVAVLLWGLCFGARAGGRRLTAVTVASLLAVFALYLVFRLSHSAPTFFPARRPWLVWAYASAQVRVFWAYARLILFPVHLSLEHDAWVPASAKDLISLTFIASLAGLAALVALSASYFRKAPEASFAILFGLLYLIPTSSVVPLVVLVNENRPYLSILALAWCLGELAAASGRKGVAVASLTAVILLFSALCSSRMGVFRNAQLSWRDAVRNAPGLSRPHVNLGVALLSYGRSDEARSEFKLALEIEPCSSQALTNLGNISYKEGARDDSERLYKKAIECDPDSYNAMLNLSDQYMEEGREKESVDLLERLLHSWPDNSDALGRLGTWYAFRGNDPARGIAYLERAAETAGSGQEASVWREAVSEAKAQKR